jgi:hypothetical protein
MVLRHWYSPLNKLDFNDAKSFIKGLEYSAAGVPFISEDMEEYSYLYNEYGIGRVAKTEDQWLSHLEDLNNPKTYYLSSGSGTPTVVPASDISLFIKNPSDSEIQSWRTQYAEKQIQLTQRSTEFQAFLNTTVAEFNTYSDLFTNVLKTIFTSLRDIASRF